MPKYRNRKFGLLHFSYCTSDSKLWALLWPMKGESWLYVSFLSRRFKRQCRLQHIFFPFYHIVWHDVANECFIGLGPREKAT